jgi:aspartate ammonia-lyase
VIAFNILESMLSMTHAMSTLADRCVRGIEPNHEVLQDYVERSIGVVTALVPVIGYAAATDIARTALETGRPVRDLVLEAGLLDEAHLSALLSPTMMTRPHRPTPTGTIPVVDPATDSGEVPRMVADDNAVTETSR